VQESHSGETLRRKLRVSGFSGRKTWRGKWSGIKHRLNCEHDAPQTDHEEGAATCELYSFLSCSLGFKKAKKKKKKGRINVKEKNGQEGGEGSNATDNSGGGGISRPTI